MLLAASFPASPTMTHAIPFSGRAASPSLYRRRRQVAADESRLDCQKIRRHFTGIARCTAISIAKRNARGLPMPLKDCRLPLSPYDNDHRLCRLDEMAAFAAYAHAKYFEA